MQGFKSRWVRVATVVALVALLVPALPASAVVEAGVSGPPVKMAEANANVSPKGIRISVKDLPADVTAIDVYRSTAAGTEGEKLNTIPVTDGSYFDESVVPSTEYFYTVKVAKRNEEADAGRFRMLDTLPQIAVTSADAPEKKVEAAAVREPRAKHDAPVTRTENPVRTSSITAQDVSGMTVIGDGAGSTILTAATTTWDLAHSPYFIREDVVVPAGKTLVIQPGVRVYFDYGTSYGSQTTTPDATVQSVSQGVDLVVHGKILAKGTASANILMSSIVSYPTSATTTGWMPAEGDWGVIYTDSKAASEISYCMIEYNSGCWSRNTARPYYSYNTLSECGYTWGPLPWEASITFQNPKADAVTPKVMVVGNTIATENNEGIVIVAADDPADSNWGLTQAGDIVLDAYIAKNTIKATYPIDLEAWDDDGSTAGNVYIRGTVTANKIWSWDNEPVYVEATSVNTQTAAVSTAFSLNTITATNDDGVYVDAYASGWGKAYCQPTFSGDVISGYDTAVNVEAYSSEDSATAVGAAYCRPKFTNCSMTCYRADVIDMYAESNNKGPADTNAVFSGGTFETAGTYGVWGEATSTYGDASSSPSFTNVNGWEHYASEFLYLEAYSDEGDTRVNPRWVGGKIMSLDDTAMYLYSEASSGSAEAKPYVANTSIKTYEYGIEAYAYGAYDSGNGNANASGTLVNSTIYGSGESSAYYAFAQCDYGKGAATCSPVVTDVHISGDVDDGIEAYAYSVDGPAVCSPVVTLGTTIEALGSAVYAYAYRNPSAMETTDNATASPIVSDSTLVSDDDECIYAEVYNYGIGNATVSPIITRSRVENHFDNSALYMYADKDETEYAGSATVAPVVTYSTLRGTDDVSVDAYAYGPGEADGLSKATIAGTFKYCNLDNPYYDGFCAGAYNYGGTSEVTPYFQDCSMQTPCDYAGYFEAFGWGGADERVYVAPTMLRVAANLAGDGFYSAARNEEQWYDWGGTWQWLPVAGSLDASSPVTCAPVIRDSNVYATWDYPSYTKARTYGDATVTANALIYNSTMKGYDSVRSDATVKSDYGFSVGDANAVNSSRVLGASSTKRSSVEAFYDYGVYNYTYSENGDCVDATQARYLNINAQDKTVAIECYSDATSTVSPIISGNVIGTKWVAQNDAISVDANGAEVSGAPNISSNSIGAVNGRGIDVYAGGASVAKFTPVVTGNSIGSGQLGVGSDGIFVQLSASDQAASKATVTNNRVAYSYENGIEVNGFEYGLVQGNKVNYPGFHNSSTDKFDTAAIQWDGASGETSGTSSVRGNMVTNARAGIAYQNGWALTQYNSFTDSYGNYNRPYNLVTDWSSSDPTMVASYNWWGATLAKGVTETIDAYNATPDEVVTYSPWLTTCAPKVTKIVKSKSGSTYTFKVYFDRPMNTAIRYLKFGKVSPFRTYTTKSGVWNTSGTMLTVKWTGTLAAGKYYFSGATDLPGNAMLSTSRYFTP